MEKLKTNNAKSIYIHIPFCLKKCNYCAFISYTNISEFEDCYVKSLIAEIQYYSSPQNIETVYFGGGTPNLLSLKNYEKIFSALNEKFNLSENAEITMEFNPKISDISYIKAVKNFGVNRLSLGIQSFNDKILTILGRLHNAKEGFEAIDTIKNSGIQNYSVDLMYGIFSQTMKDLKKDLLLLQSIKPHHISTYGLKIEENTPFCTRDKYDLPDEDKCADMYLLICDMLKSNGYNHYEISNFAKENFEAKHNLTYWNNKEYYAFGVAAHGYLSGIRFKHTNSVSEYIKNPIRIDTIKENTSQDILEETIFLGLRLKKGINLSQLKSDFEFDLYEKRKMFIDSIIKSGHAVLNGDNLKLTEKGFLISNYILSELIS